MPVTLRHHPQRERVLIIEIIGHVSMQELLDVTQQESEIISQASGIVHSIFDVRQNQGLPSSFMSSLPKIARMPAASHRNSGLKIIVGANRLVEMALTVFSRLYHKIYFVSDLDAADQVIHEQEAKIPG